MKLVIQRVKRSTIIINDDIERRINRGLVVLIGIHTEDTDSDVEWLAHKMLQMRIFPDDEGVMNRSVIDIDGELLLVSQFTLQASTKKGNRPSYMHAARPEQAVPLYNSFVDRVKRDSTLKVETGEFGADMSIELVNDGPVTIIIDSRDRY